MFIFASSNNKRSMTNFEKAVAQAKEGKLQTPNVSYGNKQIDYFGYQLATHHFNLKIMANGMKFRGVKLKDLKDYYGLKGRTAAECLPQFEKIMADYKASL
jgi:hypothetical protein